MALKWPSWLKLKRSNQPTDGTGMTTTATTTTTTTMAPAPATGTKTAATSKTAGKKTTKKSTK